MKARGEATCLPRAIFAFAASSGYVWHYGDALNIKVSLLHAKAQVYKHYLLVEVDANEPQGWIDVRRLRGPTTARGSISCTGKFSSPAWR